MTASMMMQSLYWREPLWLVLSVIPVMLLLIKKLGSSAKADSYADPDLQPWAIWREKNRQSAATSVRIILYLVSWVLLSIAMAGPRVVIEQPATQGQADLNIMLVLDVSASMNVRDVEPDRLRRTQTEVAEFLKRTSHARIGIILYTSQAHLLVPLTDDLDSLHYYLKLIGDIQLPVAGSRPAEAINMSAQELNSWPGDENAAVIWITDGDITDNKAIDELKSAVKRLQEKSIPLYINAIGSIEGDAIPDNNGKWIQHDGRPAISRLDEGLLTELAGLGDGRFVNVQADDSDWVAIYDRGIKTHFQSTLDTGNDQNVIWKDLYHWPLLPAIVLLFLSLAPDTFRYKPAASPTLPGLVLLSMLIVDQNVSHASDSEDLLITDAYQVYRSGDYSAAARSYQLLPGYTGRMGQGNSYYRLQEYENAISQFRQAVILGSTDDERGSAIYNLANATFMTGNYKQAAALYRDALVYLPAHISAKANLAISSSLQRKLDELVEQGTAGRMGTGPRSLRANPGLDINESGSLSLDDEQTEKDRLQAEISEDDLQALLSRGLEHMRLITSEADKTTGDDPAWEQELNQARIRMRELEDRQARLWNRLFEIEAGYPAPLEDPIQLPGILPW